MQKARATTAVAVVLVVVMGMVVEEAQGHGMMLQPVQRSSRWRDSRYPSAPKNYDDNQLFCGGFARQWQDNNGSCGVCGDPFDEPQPRANEANGQYGQGVIVESYTQGQVIQVVVRITANHKGYFVFKLCPHNDIHTPVTKECLDQRQLQVVTGTGDLEDRYYISTDVGNFSINLQLPSEVTCTQCVLQWTYNTGNSYGCFQDGQCCVGCGPQENFVNCADVAITPSTGTLPSSSSAQTPPSTTDTPTTPVPTTGVPTTTANAPTTHLPTTTMNAPTTTTPAPTSEATNADAGEQSSGGCRSVPPYDAVIGMDGWCQVNCAAGFCPSSHCNCS